MKSYAAWRAANEAVERERALAAARIAPLLAAEAAALPFLGDDIFVLIAAELDIRALGRLACTAQRFWRKSVADTRTRALKGSAPELWSVAEEGAQRRLAAQSETVRGWVPRSVGSSWLRALREAEKLLEPLAFTAHGDGVTLSENGAHVCRRSTSSTL